MPATDANSPAGIAFPSASALTIASRAGSLSACVIFENPDCTGCRTITIENLAARQAHRSRLDHSRFGAGLISEIGETLHDAVLRLWPASTQPGEPPCRTPSASTGFGTTPWAGEILKHRSRSTPT